MYYKYSYINNIYIFSQKRCNKILFVCFTYIDQLFIIQAFQYGCAIFPSEGYTIQSESTAFRFGDFFCFLVNKQCRGHILF